MEYRIHRKVLRMVSELHLRGYQRLRIAPGMSPSGVHWRCGVTPVTNISFRNGAMMLDWDLLSYHYSSSQGSKYFDEIEKPLATPSRLADEFIDRYPTIVEAGKGSDWMYAGWYVEMLHLTYPSAFPIAYADWDLPQDHLGFVGEGGNIRIPLPPPGLGEE